MQWNIYLSGEIHTDWRQQIVAACEKLKLPVTFSSAVTDHDASDSAGDFLGAEENPFWRDNKSAKINAIRTRTLLKNCDVAVIRFGEQYKQWNAAFDAGFCASQGTPYITLHDESLTHALKEVDAAAQAWTKTPEDVVEILKYTTLQWK